MRTGARGIFPAYYAIEVTKDPESYKGTRAELIFMIFRNYIIESPFKQASCSSSLSQTMHSTFSVGFFHWSF